MMESPTRRLNALRGGESADRACLPAAEHADAGRLLRCSLTTGEVLAEYVTPGAAQVTCPALLPTDDGTMLIATTAAEHLSPERLAMQPDAGCLFAIELPAAE